MCRWRAVTQANRISFLFQVAMFGAISGASIFVAQYWGRRDVRGVRRTQGIATVFGLLVAALLGIPSILAPEWIMRLLISSEAGVQAGAEYLRVIGFVYFVQSQSLIQAAVLKSTEQVKLPMFASLAAICTNVVFNTLLIYPTREAQLLGLTFTMPGAGMGVRGGALATLIGACVELFSHSPFFPTAFRFANAARPRELLPRLRARGKSFLVIALPVLLNEALWAGGTVMYSAVYGRIGDGVAASAAAGVFSNVEQLASIAGARAQPRLRRDGGHGVWARASATARVSTGKRFLIATPLNGAGVRASRYTAALRADRLHFPRLCGNSAHGAEMIYILCGGTWLNALNTVIIVSILRTGGDVRTAAAIDVGSLWLVGVPAAWAAGLLLKWDIAFVYMVTYLEQLAKAAAALWRYRQGRWIRTIVREDA